MVVKAADMKTKPNIIKVGNGIHRLDLRGKAFRNILQTVSGGKRSLEFPTKAAAEKKAGEIEDLLAQYGTKKLETLESTLRMDPAELSERLAPFGKTIMEAVDFYVEHLKNQQAIQNSNIVSLLLDEWLAEKKRRMEQNTLRKATYESLYYKAGGYRKQWGDRPVASITRKEIVDWLETTKVKIGKNTFVPASQVSKQHRLAYLSQFFIWCKKTYSIPKDNPCEFITIERNENAGAVDYFKTDEAQRIMAQSITKRFISLLPYHAICLFSGVRSAECERLTWNSIDLEDNRIVLMNTDAKTFARRVEMRPNLVAWLKWFKTTYPQYPLIPKNGFSDRKRQFRKCIGFVWCKNGCRHSYASYYLGARYGGYGELEQNMGNSRQMLQKHYLNYPNREDSATFWNIQPPV